MITIKFPPWRNTFSWCFEHPSFIRAKDWHLKKDFFTVYLFKNYGNLTLINFHFHTNAAPQLLKKLLLHSFPINHWLFSRNDSLKENVQKIQISSSINKFPTPIEINNNDDNIHLFISIHPSTSQVMFTVKIFTCADDIPLGVFGGTCIELTLGGRPENKKKNHNVNLTTIHKKLTVKLIIMDYRFWFLLTQEFLFSSSYTVHCTG